MIQKVLAQQVPEQVGATIGGGTHGQRRAVVACVLMIKLEAGEAGYDQDHQQVSRCGHLLAAVR